MPESVINEQWVVLTLGPKAEGEDPEVIAASIRHIVRGAEVFIPASVTKIGDERVVQYLVDGYAFVRHQFPDSSYWKLEDTKYVESVLKTVKQKGGRLVQQVSTVGSAEIDRLRGQIRVEVDQGIGVGDTVLVTSGTYKHITAIVDEDIPELDSVQVYIKLRSKEALVTLPRACLRLVRKSVLVTCQRQCDALKAWSQAVHILLEWPEGKITPLLEAYRRWKRLEGWETLREECRRLLDGAKLPRQSKVDTLVDKGKTLEQLERGAQLYTLFKHLYEYPIRTPINEIKIQEYTYLQGTLDRLSHLESELAAIEKRLGSKENMKIVNLVVDGTQLVIRCGDTPGLGDLKDKQGRPTGAIIGFLRCLASYKKKFEPEVIYVCWDGSSQRRKKLYSGYKANRIHHAVSFESDWLKANLAYFGVHQTTSTAEEADDLIASLAHGPLKGQPTVIVSTDRDLTQLVTDTVLQYVPAVGGGKEKLLDPEGVRQEFGVLPNEVVQVRALAGDSSDEVPGAPGVGVKTAAQLIRVYGDVNTVLGSNLAGLRSNQIAGLRASTAQVRLNLDILKLYCDLPVELKTPTPDSEEADKRLQELDIKPGKMLETLLGSG